jgi:hypothetical protein
MGPLVVVEAVAGGLLLFVVPGFAVAKAVFPERRLRSPGGVRWAIELAALALVLSVVLTVVVGYVLLAAAQGGFSASWSDPLLESGLAAIALVAFVVGVLEGAYARRAPARPASATEPEETDPMALARRLDLLQRQRRALERDLRRLPPGDAEEGERLRRRIERLAAEEQELREHQEAEYAA